MTTPELILKLFTTLAILGVGGVLLTLLWG